MRISACGLSPRLATPRMRRRRRLMLRNAVMWVVQMLVIDEADEMLNKGFKEQIYDIYR